MKTSKKLLSIVLCLALLLSFPVSMAVSAETDEAALKQTLIEAWNGLGKEVGTTITYPTAWNAKPIEELKANLATDLSGDKMITDDQLAKMGSHYFTMSVGDGRKVTWDHTNKLSVIEGYEKITWPVYSPYFGGYVRMYIGNQLTGGSAKVREGNVGPTGGLPCFMEIDCTAALTGVQMNGLDVEVVETYNGQNGPVYFGSVVGYKTEYAAAPENAATMTAKELYEAAKAVDLTQYTIGVEAFETALADLYDVAYPELAALIEAWNGLKAEEAVVIAYPRNTTPIAEFPTNLGLTAAEIAGFGDCFLKVSGTGKSAGWESPYKYQSLTEFHKITTSVYTTAAGSKLENALERADGGGNLYYARSWSALSAGLTVLDSTSNFAAFLDGTTSFNACTYHVYEGTGDVYIGATLGWKYVAEKAPENAAAMTAKELYEAAAAVDLTQYAAGVEAFEAALADLYDVAYPELAALIEAWNGLGKVEKTTLAYPQAGTAVDENTDVGFADNSVLGSHYLTVSNGNNAFVGSRISLDDYDSVYFYVKGTADLMMNVCIDYNFVMENRYCGYRTEKIAFPVSGTLNYIQIWGDGAFVLGSVIGEKTVYATAPENAAAMTAKELYEAAKAVDLTQYNVGVEDFETALAALGEAEAPVATETTEGGTVAVDDVFAADGETVTVTVAPEEGYVLKAGSLAVYDAAGNVVAIPTRDGFQTDTAVTGKYTFEKKAGDVTVKAEYVKLADLTAPNMGRIGNSVKTEIGGMRSVYRMPITWGEDGKCYVTFGGETKEVTAFGMLVCSEATYTRLGGMDITMEDQYLKNVNFMESNFRYDMCADYEDISVIVTGLNEMTDKQIYSRGYIVVDGATYYTDAVARCYADYVS